uniref:Uncharacterized protein n=1 Tax=Ficus carica TaxID=3494 RepID=A0AA88E9H6_FICCA|nr:hypothetical protein TIFTF001_039251 [Ficus carica]
MRPSGRYRQPPGHDRGWPGEGRGLHLPPGNEVPRRGRGTRVPGKPGGREEVLHGGGQQSVPKGPCPDHCGDHSHGGRSQSPERRCCTAE